MAERHLIPFSIEHGSSSPKVVKECGSPFDLLPNELLVQIFGNLDLSNLSLVWLLDKERLVDLCNYVRYRRDRDCLIVEEEWDLQTFQRIIFMGSSCLAQLYMDAKNNDDDDSLVIIALKNIPSLRLIKFYCGAFSPAVMAAIGNHGSLGIVLITGCRNYQKSIHPISTTALASNAFFLRNLVAIDMQEAVVDDKEDETWVRAIVDTCRGYLRALYLPTMIKPKEPLFNYIFDQLHETLWEILVNGNELTDAAFSRIKNSKLLMSVNLQGANNLGAEGLRAIAKHHSRLLQLSISCVTFISQDFATVFGGKIMGNLAHLGLMKGKGLDEEVVEIFAANCPNLVRLNLADSDISDRGIGIFLRRCRKIRTMILTKASGVTARAFSVNIGGGSSNEYGRSLGELYVDQGLSAEVAKILPWCRVMVEKFK